MPKVKNIENLIKFRNEIAHDPRYKEIVEEIDYLIEFRSKTISSSDSLSIIKIIEIIRIFIWFL